MRRLVPTFGSVHWAKHFADFGALQFNVESCNLHVQILFSDTNAVTSIYSYILSVYGQDFICHLCSVSLTETYHSGAINLKEGSLVQVKFALSRRFHLGVSRDTWRKPNIILFGVSRDTWKWANWKWANASNSRWIQSIQCQDSSPGTELGPKKYPPQAVPKIQGHLVTVVSCVPKSPQICFLETCEFPKIQGHLVTIVSCVPKSPQIRFLKTCESQVGRTPYQSNHPWENLINSSFQEVFQRSKSASRLTSDGVDRWSESNERLLLAYFRRQVKWIKWAVVTRLFSLMSGR